MTGRFSLTVLGAGALIVALFAGGYALGRGSRVTTQQAVLVAAGARSLAYTHARRTAAADADRLGRSEGARRGRIAGNRQGAASGRAAGVKHLAKLRAAQAKAAKARAAQAAAANASAGGCPAGLVPQGTLACVLPGTANVGGASAGCGGDPYSTPTRYGGCIGPAAPPSSANSGPATNCPAGWIPVGSAGACAPASQP
jgi:hypothetical protein